MRELKLALVRSGNLLSFFCATWVASGCGATTSNSPGQGDATGGVLGHASSGGSGGLPIVISVGPGQGGTSAGGVSGSSASGGAAGGSGVGGARATGSGGNLANYPFEVGHPAPECMASSGREVVVPVPDEGVPARLDALCAAAESLVSSGWAARIAFEPSADGLLWKGTLKLAPGLEKPVAPPRITLVSLDGRTDTPTFTVSEGVDGTWLLTMKLTQRMASFGSDSLVRMVLAADLELACEPRKKTVRAQTILHWCGQGSDANWVSSGDDCAVCATICEMAPSPAFAAIKKDQMALSDSIRARVRVLRRVDDALVLFAEHDAGPERCQYTWQVTSGTLLFADRDVAIWLPAASGEPELAQVAVDSGVGAAVATLRWSDPV